MYDPSNTNYYFKRKLFFFFDQKQHSQYNRNALQPRIKGHDIQLFPALLFKMHRKTDRNCGLSQISNIFKLLHNKATNLDKTRVYKSVAIAF